MKNKALIVGAALLVLLGFVRIVFPSSDVEPFYNNVMIGFDYTMALLMVILAKEVKK
ncbi:MAG: hypothetical protein ACPGF7_09490 [Pontibacterium sp.]